MPAASWTPQAAPLLAPGATKPESHATVPLRKLTRNLKAVGRSRVPWTVARSTTAVKTGLTDTPTGHSILGVTVLAWANSIGDFIADTAVTKAGKPEMGVSAVFGSPMLTCCLGIGISTLVASGGPGGYVTTLLDGELLVSFLFMAISLGSSMCVIIFSGFQLPRWYAFYLLGVYAAYMLLSMLVVTNVVDLGGHKEAQQSRCPAN